VRKHRDKAAVESAVQVINKRVIGYLAEEVWTVVDDLNAAIAARLVEINEKIRRADGTTGGNGSRRSKPTSRSRSRPRGSTGWSGSN
jgi:hypothetical protein